MKSLTRIKPFTIINFLIIHTATILTFKTLLCIIPNILNALFYVIWNIDFQQNLEGCLKVMVYFS